MALESTTFGLHRKHLKEEEIKLGLDYDVWTWAGVVYLPLRVTMKVLVFELNNLTISWVSVSDEEQMSFWCS